MYGQTRYDVNDIKFRIQKNAGFTADELVCLLEHDKPARFDFMVLNNPGNVNETLKYKLGDETLPFLPDPKAIQAHVDILIKKGDDKSLDIIERYFKVSQKNVTTADDAELIKLLNKHFNNWF